MRRPRGERNNNPGNIRHGDPWLGLAQEQTDPNFCTFITPFHGIRALCKTLLTYQRLHNKRTLEQILFRWAPPIENDTEAYIESVARSLGVDPRAPIDIVDDPDLLMRLAKAIIRHENGQVSYSDDEIAAGAMDAIGSLA